MTTSTSTAPHGMPTMLPHLTVKDGRAAMAFYEKALGATEMFSLDGPDGRLMHGSMCVNGAAFMLMDEFLEHNAKSPKSLGGTPVGIHLWVDDVDEAFDRAIAAGSTPIMKPADIFWGDRYSVVEDPFGHHWSFAKHLKDMSPDDIKSAMMSAPPMDCA